MNPIYKDFASVSILGPISRSCSRLLLAGAALGWLWAAAPSVRADISREAQWSLDSGGNGHTYRAVATAAPLSWDAADAAARAAGGYLATITSAQENAFVFSLVDNAAFWQQSINDHGPWLGGFQAAGAAEPSGGWGWVTQPGAASPEPFSFSNWEVGEPNNMTATVNGVTYNQDRISYFHEGTGRAATWSDEFDLINNSLNHWTFSYVIEFNAVPEPTTGALLAVGGLLLALRRAGRR